jgi:hypothetical protein
LSGTIEESQFYFGDSLRKIISEENIARYKQQIDSAIGQLTAADAKYLYFKLYPWK